MADYNAVLPERSRASELWTWADAVDSVLDYFDRAKSGRDERLALRAVEDAYREFPTRHDWKFLHRRMMISTSATYATGTVAFDLTGGTYERMLTLTDGTWPADAAYGNVEIDLNHYECADRKSDSIVTLRSDACPTADVAAGETYRWYRDCYPLPPDFMRIGEVFEASRGEEYPLCSVEREYVERNNRAGGSYYTGNAEWFCIGSDKRYVDPVICLSPIPEDATTYEATYQARCRPLTTYEYSTGTVICVARRDGGNRLRDGLDKCDDRSRNSLLRQQGETDRALRQHRKQDESSQYGACRQVRHRWNASCLGFRSRCRVYGDRLHDFRPLGFARSHGRQRFRRDGPVSLHGPRQGLRRRRDGTATCVCGTDAAAGPGCRPPLHLATDRLVQQRLGLELYGVVNAEITRHSERNRKHA
jgi:hypothetical protein